MGVGPESGPGRQPPYGWVDIIVAWLNVKVGERAENLNIFWRNSQLLVGLAQRSLRQISITLFAAAAWKGDLAAVRAVIGGAQDERNMQLLMNAVQEDQYAASAGRLLRSIVGVPAWAGQWRHQSLRRTARERRGQILLQTFEKLL